MRLSLALLSAAAVPLSCSVALAQGADGTLVLPPVTVFGSPLGQAADDMATPVLTLSGTDLERRREATLGGTLAGQPGVNFENFGGGGGRPVIRGQVAPRVMVLSDGSDTNGLHK